MEKNKNFIMTTDEGTAQQLISLGYELLSQSGKNYTFINDTKKINYIENTIPKNKIAFANFISI